MISSDIIWFPPGFVTSYIDDIHGWYRLLKLPLEPRPIIVEKFPRIPPVVHQAPLLRRGFAVQSSCAGRVSEEQSGRARGLVPVKEKKSVEVQLVEYQIII
eukprot:SAG22_NODE_757_length_7441_cov_29.224326_5_plen_101_part_00